MLSVTYAWEETWGVNYCLALQEIINPKNVISIGKIAGNNYGVFFNNSDDCQKVRDTEFLIVKGHKIKINDFTPRVKTIYVKNVPVVDNLKPLTDFLSGYGEIKEQPKRLKAKEVPDLWTHCVSHTIILKMVLDESKGVLPGHASIDLGSDITTVKIEYPGSASFVVKEVT